VSEPTVFFLQTHVVEPASPRFFNVLHDPTRPPPNFSLFKHTFGSAVLASSLSTGLTSPCFLYSSSVSSPPLLVLSSGLFLGPFSPSMCGPLRPCDLGASSVKFFLFAPRVTFASTVTSFSHAFPLSSSRRWFLVRSLRPLFCAPLTRASPSPTQFPFPDPVLPFLVPFVSHPPLPNCVFPRPRNVFQAEIF